MDQKTINEAVENISLIKGVIDRTSKSFVAFSKIFIYWGLLFILNSVISLVTSINMEKVLDLSRQYPALNFVPVIVITLLAILIYQIVSKKVPLVGLEKHLMKVWMLILLLNVIPSKITVNTPTASMDFASISVKSDNFSIMLFSLAIALIVTYLFTSYKQLCYIGVLYIAISVLHAYTNFSIYNSTLFMLLKLLVIPFTFIYTGLFLRSRQARGN